MKLKIQMTVSDAVSVNGLPEETVESSKSMTLELPVSVEEFVEAVETLLTDNLVKAVQPLVNSVDFKATAVLARMKKSGLSQPELLPPAEGTGKEV